MKMLQKTVGRAVLLVALILAVVMQDRMTVFAAGTWTMEENIIYAVKGQPCSLALTYDTAVSYECGNTLPAGIAFDSVTGILSGTPEHSGETTITIKACGENKGTLASKDFIFSVTDVPYYGFTAQVNDKTMGSINVSDGRMQEGTLLTVEVKANEGYRIDSVLVNGSKVEGIQTESISHVLQVHMDKDQSVYASFVPLNNSGHATEIQPGDIPGNITDGSIVDDNIEGNEVEEKTEELQPVEEVLTEEAVPEPVEKTVSPTQLQTLNYKDNTLTEWQEILAALKTLNPEMVTNPDTGGKRLVLQLQNVKDIPAGIKDSIGNTEGSDYSKILQCNLGCGVSMVFNGAADNSGFTGIGNANVAVATENRGKKSVATTIWFESHAAFGTVASLQINLPQCKKGTKVSVYAETKTTDGNGNVTLGENVCIGNTKADENGNVEVAIQSTANYMFVYKVAQN